MTVIDKRQVIKNYVEHANERVLDALNIIIELYENKFEDNNSDIRPFTSEQQKMYDIAISGLDIGDRMPHEEFMAEMRKRYTS